MGGCRGGGGVAEGVGGCTSRSKAAELRKRQSDFLLNFSLLFVKDQHPKVAETKQGELPFCAQQSASVKL